MPFSASTCLTYTGTTTLGPTFNVYTNPTSPTIPGTYLMDVPTSSITGGNCPYTFIVPDNTTTIRLFDPISLCYADIPITTPGSQTGYCLSRCQNTSFPDPVYASPCWSNVLQPKVISSSPSLEVYSVVTGTDGYCYYITEVIPPENYTSIAGPVITSTGTLNYCYECREVNFNIYSNITQGCTGEVTNYLYYRSNNGPWVSVEVGPVTASGQNLSPTFSPGTTVDYYFSTNNNLPWGISSSDYTSKCGQTLTYTVTNDYDQNINLYVSGVWNGGDCQFGTPC